MFDLHDVISLVKQFRGDRRGVTALEYGLIASGVAVAIIAGVTLLGGNLQCHVRRRRRADPRSGVI